MNCLVNSPQSPGIGVIDAGRRLGRLALLSMVMLFTRLGEEPLMASPPPADVERSFCVPILSVTSGNQGDCSRPRLVFSRKAGDAAPLSMAVVEDTPGGAGESVRASLWMAAIVAALDRMDPLAGTKISLELSGTVDGPSAGAGICLAILSALDGREFPQDCAVTGAIMPDGTIGGVGGLVPKLRAAARFGIRRVMIPTYVRFELQPGETEEVDLKRLAAELKLELIAIENVTQAYSALHGLAGTPRGLAERTAPALPDATEEALKQSYRLHQRAGVELWNAVSQTDRDGLNGEPTFKALFVDQQADAEKAYRSGWLGLAASSARNWHVALAARKAYVEYAAAVPKDELIPRDALDAAAKTKRRFAELAKGFLNPETLVSSRPALSEAGAQLWGDYYVQAGITAYNDVIQAVIEDRLQAASQPGLKAAELESIRDDVFARGQIQLILAHMAVESARSWAKEQELLAATLPARSIGSDSEEVERLFYNSHLAVRNTFRHDVVAAHADDLHVSHPQVLAALRTMDARFVLHEPAVSAAEVVHARAIASQEVALRRFALAVSTHLQAEALATQSALIVRWSQLDAEADEQLTLSYGRTDLLNYLITTARENALRALGDCGAKDLVPIVPLMRFETAEMSRDDVQTDKVEVLNAYWSATLHAKALLMLCGTIENKIVEVPKVSAPSPAVGRFQSPATMPDGTAPLATAESTSRALQSPTRRLDVSSPVGTRAFRPGSSPRVPNVSPDGRSQTTSSSGKEREPWTKIVPIIGALMFLNWLQQLWRDRALPAAAPPQMTLSKPTPTTFNLLPRFAYSCGAAVRRVFKLFS